MKRYVLMVAYEPGVWAEASDEVRQSYVDAHGAFERYVAEHGRKLASAPLADADSATTVRHAGGEVVVSDGPFVELAEQVGGYYDVELPDLDSAIAAATLLPPTYAVEIRPAIVIDGHDPA